MLYQIIFYVYLSTIYGPYLNYMGNLENKSIKQTNNYTLLINNLSNINNIKKYIKHIACILFLITICLLYYDYIETKSTKSNKYIVYLTIGIHIYLIYLFLSVDQIPLFVYNIIEYSGLVISIFYLYNLIILLYK